MALLMLGTATKKRSTDNSIQRVKTFSYSTHARLGNEEPSSRDHPSPTPMPSPEKFRNQPQVHPYGNTLMVDP